MAEHYDKEKEKKTSSRVYFVSDCQYKELCKIKENQQEYHKLVQNMAKEVFRASGWHREKQN